MDTRHPNDREGTHSLPLLTFDDNGHIVRLPAHNGPVHRERSVGRVLRGAILPYLAWATVWGAFGYFAYHLWRLAVGL